MDESFPIDREQRVKGERLKGGFWREVFIVSITIIFTVMGIVTIESCMGYGIDGEKHPLGARIVLWTFLAPECFLLIFSRFFFRHLGSLARVGWESAIAVLIWFLLWFVANAGRA